MFLTPETDNKQILRRGVYPEHGRRAPQNDIATSPQGDRRQAYNSNFRGRIIAVLAIGALFGFATWAASVHAQEPFYRGKTIRLIVGLAPGGGYDLYSRVIARHMGKHIPGNPTIVVDNMTGAGSVIAANYMYNAAKPDGLTIGHVLGAATPWQSSDQVRQPQI